MINVGSNSSVTTITINDRETKNALSNSTRTELLAALRQAVGDTNCAAIILTGANETFCAGGELSSMPTEELKIRSRIGEMHDILRLIYIGPKPVVAAIDGAAFGSGFSLAAACDYVVATKRASFGCSFGRVGLIADTGLLWTLPGKVGENVCRHIVLENRRVPAEQGLALGLVDEISSPEDLLNLAFQRASAFSIMAPMAIAATKRLLTHSRSDFEQLLSAELDAQIEMLASDDFAEGRSAFLEKRPANFRRTSVSNEAQQYDSPPENA